MSNVIRLIVGVPGGIIVTVFLFLVLAAMISSRGNVQLDEDRSVQINVTRQLQDTQTQQQQDFQRPVLDQPPPPPPTVTDPSFRPTQAVQMGELPDRKSVV
jgi:periplasmic protein TonB